jgi:hypothetical protein
MILQDTCSKTTRVFGLLSQHGPRMKAQGFEEVVNQLAEKFVEQKCLVGIS